MLKCAHTTGVSYSQLVNSVQFEYAKLQSHYDLKVSQSVKSEFLSFEIFCILLLFIKPCSVGFM